MPLVTIQMGKDFDGGYMRMFASHIQLAVANALSCEEGKLEPAEVEVMLTRVDPDRHVGYKDLEITVVANDYPSRQAKLFEAKMNIARQVKFLLPSPTRTWHVWVQLVPASYTDNLQAAKLIQ
jgi:hypothetical protein